MREAPERLSMAGDCRTNWMSFDDGMAEVAGILAAGILRRRKREMNQMIGDGSFANTGLDVAEESAHCTTPLPKGACPERSRRKSR